MIIDARDLILGRMASYAAKRLLEGDEVKIINAEQAVITGSRKMLLKKYLERRDRTNKHHGPFYPKMPDKIVKRTIRGMLPYKHYRGRKAFKKLRVYIGTPENIDASAAIQPEELHIKNSGARKYVKLGELSKLMGADI